MRRLLGFSAVLAVFAGIVTYSYAGSPGQMQGGGMMNCGRMMDHDSNCVMHKMGCGMGMMMPRQILAVDDGIIVSVGNKLVKYDNDLNKKKEVTIEYDTTGMNAMMGKRRFEDPKPKDTMKPAIETQKKK